MARTDPDPGPAPGLLHRMGFRSRLIALGLLASLLSALMVGGVGYRATDHAARSGAEALLAAEARLNAERVMAPLQAMRSEAAILTRLPIIRLMAPGAGRSAAERAALHDRLGLVLTSLLRERPAYFQARLILLADGGREVLRIENGARGPRKAPAAALQRKGAEPYMQPLMTGGARHGYFSGVSLNREHGRVQQAAPVTLRYVQPLQDAAGTVFGALVLNADLARLLGAITPHLAPDHRLHVLTGSGDHIRLGPRGPESALRFHGAPGFTPLDWPGAGQPVPEAGARFAAQGTVAYALTRGLPGAEGAAGLTTIVTVPRAVLLAPAHRLLRNATLLAALAGLGALALSFLVWRLTTRPIRPLLSLTEAALARHAAGGTPPVQGSGDEIHDLRGSLLAALTNLSEASERAGAMFQGTADGVMMLRRDGTITEINPSALAIFGYAAGAEINLARLIPPDWQDPPGGILPASDAPPGRRGAPAMRPVTGRRADGRAMALEVSVSPIDYHGETQFVAMVRDISERAAAEAEREALITDLARAKARLERSNADLDGFAYVASHDLKAPLRVIDNAARWLEEDLGPGLDPESQENLALMRSRVARMERLLDDLLTHSRIGRQDHPPDLVDGASLLQAVVELTDPPEGFRVRLAPGLSAITLPRMPLQCVLLNLMSNAIKHHDRADGCVTVSAAETAEAHVFTVADDGPGIDPDYHERIFEMFTTLRPRDQVEGSGMGLAMVHKTLAMVGGRITLDSAPGRGSRFIVTWPKTPAEPRPAPAPPGLHGAPATAGRAAAPAHAHRAA